MDELRFLTLAEVLALHERGIELYGGAGGVRDLGLVESATLAPQQTLDGDYLCRSIEEMAAAYWHGLTMNHGFIDGNKRVALRAADVFLSINGLNLNLEPDIAAQATEDVASGHLTRAELVKLIKGAVEGHSAP